MTDLSIYKQASGYVCSSLVTYDFEGEAYQRACGRCARCRARAKQDITGRAGAEAVGSAEVLFWTLTYSNDHAGHKDFVTPDRQKFMKRLRTWLRDETRRRLGYPKRKPRDLPVEEWLSMKRKLGEETPRVKFMGAGERGDRGTKRCHWHILCFADKPTGLVETPRDDAGRYIRQPHKLWKLGFATLEIVPPDQPQTRAQKARYVAKYVDKAREVTYREKRRGVPEKAKFFRSTRPALGREFLEDHARAVAQAGLPLSGVYNVPGLTNSPQSAQTEALVSGRVPKAPRVSRFKLKGVMAKHYIAAYREEWEALRPNQPVPLSEWMRRHDCDWIDDCIAKSDPATGDPDRARIGSDRRGPLPQGRGPLPPNDKVQPGYLAIKGPDGSTAGILGINRAGVATYTPRDRRLDKFQLTERGLKGAAGVRVADVLLADEWLRDRRGPGWVSPEQRRAYDRRLEAERREAIARFAKDGPELAGLHMAAQKVTALTGLRRQLAMRGASYQEGQVVRDGVAGQNYVSTGANLRRKISAVRP